MLLTITENGDVRPPCVSEMQSWIHHLHPNSLQCRFRTTVLVIVRSEFFDIMAGHPGTLNRGLRSSKLFL